MMEEICSSFDDGPKLVMGDFNSSSNVQAHKKGNRGSKNKLVDSDTNPNLSSRRRRKPFRFDPIWAREESTKFVVKNAWNQQVRRASPLFIIETKLKKTKDALKIWNRTTFVHFKEIAKQKELYELLRRNEMLLELMDLTTIMGSRRYNYIDHILLDDDSKRISDWKGIGKCFEQYYSNLFSTNNPSFLIDLNNLIPCSISDTDNSELCCVPSVEEITTTVFSMSSSKCPGPDGMSSLFFKTYWNIIKNDVILAVQNFFNFGQMLRSLNHTFLALIPKRDKSYKVEDFRPISLCNVAYKIIAKIISNRLRPFLGKIITPFQSAFVPNRSINDNSILCHEIMHYFNKKRGKVYFMAVKIDMTKAYDLVEWPLLLKILSSHGFSDKFTNLIHECISVTSFSILVNGSPFGSFTPTRGIRQGDPMSPALFVTFFDLLSRFLTRAEDEGKIHGVKVSRTSPRISHLMYADDLVVFCKATETEAGELLKCLKEYCDLSGQQMNIEKSSIHFSNNVDQHTRNQICEQMGMLQCDHRGTYLGLPFCKGPSSQEHVFQYVIDKVGKKLDEWKMKALSQAGRSILIKSVALTIPTYPMQIFALPKSLCQKIDGMCRDFWWGHDDDGKRHLYLKTWDSICAPKEAGGLGFRRSKDFNIAFGTKLCWIMQTDKVKLWVKLLREKYLKGKQLLEVESCPKDASWIWSNIWEHKENLEKSFYYKVGNGASIRIWLDPWIPGIANFKPALSLRSTNSPELVKDLIEQCTGCWKVDLVKKSFPPSIAAEILKIRIPSNGEPDKPIWLPTKTGSFSIKSSYRVSNRDRFSSNSAIPRALWKKLWNSNLCIRHKHFVWNFLTRTLPTKSRLGMIFDIIDEQCIICGEELETMEHLFLRCPVSVRIWRNSKWQFRIEDYADWRLSDWVEELLNPDNGFPLNSELKAEFLVFAVVAMEEIWEYRNHLSHGGGKICWDEASNRTNRLAREEAIRRC